MYGRYADKEARKAYLREWKKRHYTIEGRRRRAALWKQKHPDRWERMDVYYRRRIRRHYNMTMDDLKNMLSAQNHCCAICNKPLKINKENRHRPYVIDHSNNQVRGILCRQCNVRLAWLEPNIDRILAYLRFQKSPC